MITEDNHIELAVFYLPESHTYRILHKRTRDHVDVNLLPFAEAHHGMYESEDINNYVLSLAAGILSYAVGR